MHSKTPYTNNTQKSHKGLLSADPHKAMQEMMDTIDHMRGVYEQETEALENLDAKTFLDLQADKLEATRAYKAGIEEILIRKEDMRNVDVAIKDNLKRMQNDFADLSAKNMTALKRMQRSMERLSGTIQNAAKESVNKQNAFSYGDSGKLHKNERKSVSIGVSETA